MADYKTNLTEWYSSAVDLEPRYDDLVGMILIKVNSTLIIQLQSGIEI